MRKFMRFKLQLVFCIAIISSEVIACRIVTNHRHTNPDGSVGGFISNFAEIDSSAYVGINAKVCDNAQVKKNAKILGQAVVSENAYIRENSIIDDNAVISGNALVWSQVPNSPAIVRGNAKVYGRAKILMGTKVEGFSKVFGSSLLENSHVYDLAEVCLGALIKNEDISSNYFCDTEVNTSREVFNLKKYSLNAFNKPQDKLQLQSSGELSSDNRFLEVIINGENLPTEDLRVQSRSVDLDGSKYIHEGFNTVSISGRDKYRKEIEGQTFTFLVGNSEKFISLSGSPIISAKASANIRGVDYEIPTEILNGGVKLVAIPSDIGVFRIKLSILTKDEFFVDQFPIDSLPESIYLNPIPSFVNNTTSIGTNLSSWSISDSARVTINGSSANLTFSSADLFVTKMFHLSASDSGLSFGMNIIDSSSIFDNTLEIQASYFSLKSGRVTSTNILLSDLAKLSSQQRSFKVGFNNDLHIDDEVIFSLRLRSLIPGAKIQQRLELSKGKIKVVDVLFTPESMSVMNRKVQEGISLERQKSVPNSGVDCSSPEGYSVADETRYKPSVEAIKFLSIGDRNSLTKYIENRIYGTLSFENLNRKDIEDIRLIVWHYNAIKFEPRISVTRLSKCNLEMFENLPSDSKVKFTTKKDLSRPLFAISASSLADFDKSNGQKIVMYVEADIRTVNGLETIESDSLALDTLVSVAGSYSLGIEEDYDSSAVGVVRTGGDKWVLPAYSGMIGSMISSGSTPEIVWGVGDLAKLNGGTFLGHQEHTDGRDADIKFKDIDTPGHEFYFNFKLISGEDDWNKFLDSFENLLKGMKDKFKYIQDIYLTRKEVAEDIDASEWLNVRFANRCFEGRLIQFERSKREGSLIIAMPGHWHHAHIKLNEVDGMTGNPVAYSLDSKPTDDLDKFYYELDSSGQNLKITPISSSFLVDKNIAWRFQNIDEYRDFDMDLELGPLKNVPSEALKIITSKSSIPKKFIKLTIAYKGSGSCVQREVEIDPKVAKKLKRWTMELNGTSKKWQMTKFDR